MPNATPAAIALLCSLLCCLLCPAPCTARTHQNDCRLLQELYRDCHRLGGQSADVRGCVDAGGEYVARALRNLSAQGQTARALAAVVSQTACEDAIAGQPPASDQEIAEAFCDQSAPAKAQGARP
jgi:hypothetical protein